jgi:hypothetical protein
MGEMQWVSGYRENAEKKSGNARMICFAAGAPAQYIALAGTCGFEVLQRHRGKDLCLLRHLRLTSGQSSSADGSGLGRSLPEALPIVSFISKQLQ